MVSLLKELKRRNVFKVAAMYLVVGWGLVQISDTIAPMMNLPEWAPRTVLFFLIIGFPIAIVLSWAFELTSKGITADKKGQANIVLIAVGAILLTGGFYWSYQTLNSTSGPDTLRETTANANRGVTIAVLPFVNMSDDASNEFFSDGISEEILNVLVQVDGLSVTSRTSSFAFKSNTPNIPDIAKTLNVDHVLEGSVRKSGNMVRITAQLIDAKADKHLWSETFDRELTDIFAIQDEIANAIVMALKGTLGDSIPTITVAPITKDMSAYEMYLKARELFITRRVEQSILLFETALARDPEFAKAWEGLATAYSVASTYIFSDEGDPFDRDIAWEKASSAANQALKLNPNLALPHSVLGRYYGEQNQWKKSQEEHNLAVKLNPKQPTVRLWRGIRYLYLGYLDKAVADLKLAQQLNPDASIFISFYVRALMANGEFKEALPYAIESWENGRGTIPHIFLYNGNTEAAFFVALLQISFTESLAEADHIPIVNAWLDLASTKGDSSTQRAHLLELINKNGPLKTNRTAFWLHKSVWTAHQYTTFFQENAANRFMIWEQIAKQYRQSAEFKAMAKDMGMVSYWQENGWPKQCQPLSGEDFECE